MLRIIKQVVNKLKYIEYYISVRLRESLLLK